MRKFSKSCGGDCIPCELVVLNKGTSYFEMKNQEEQEKKKEKCSDRRCDRMTTLTGRSLNFLPGPLLKLVCIGGLNVSY